ncbi:methyl-accepting chemotaxis protein [Trinickia sp.]|uniref:methyl-accepting chemotaxis protein n=1 Tax=Trinickia sp. TaxID=2571163 RepID=UPI003F7F867A
MNALSQVSVARKLQIVLAVALASLLLVGAFGAIQIARIASQSEAIGGRWMPAAMQAQRTAQLAATVRNKEFAYILVRYDQRDQVLPELKKSIDEMSSQLKAFGELQLGDAERKTYELASAEWRSYLAADAKIQDEVDNASPNAARAIIMQDSAKSFDRLTAELAALANASQAEATHAGEDATRAARRSLTLIAVAVVVAAAIAAALMTLVARAISVPLNAAVAFAQTVARGDLTVNIRARGNDEVAHVIRSLSEMSDRLRKLIGEVRDGVESVNTASNEIAAGNLDLSARTEKVAFSVQQTATYMHQLGQSATQSTETALQVNTLSRQAFDAAERGGDIVARVVTSMNEITTSSTKINDIIGVIDGIAFQTNILALNAAVEAARAGEQGRGFAVVASEVRALAQRSAAAAKEIKELIESSVNIVDTGGQLVGEAGGAMSDIIEAVRHVSTLIGEIADASQAQQRDLGQVREAVVHIDETTQQNAALVEESASAAASLRDQADRLAALVAVFKVNAA